MAPCRFFFDAGWMHNRPRMIAAMFLTKDLMIDWRLGERVRHFPVPPSLCPNQPCRFISAFHATIY